MGLPTKVQLIKRQASEQWYINFPSAVAQALEFQKGESVEWIIEDESPLALRRHAPAAPALKNSALLDHFLDLWQGCLPPLQDRVADRAQTLALSSLLWDPLAGGSRWDYTRRKLRCKRGDIGLQDILQRLVCSL